LRTRGRHKIIEIELKWENLPSKQARLQPTQFARAPIVAKRSRASATEFLLDMGPFQKILRCTPPIRDYACRVDWQQFVSLLVVAATAGALLWSRFRRRKFSFARDTHCGCSTTAQSPVQGSIIFRARKGERRQIVVKAK
jgi:hypothetical protein